MGLENVTLVDEEKKSAGEERSQPLLERCVTDNAAAAAAAGAEGSKPKSPNSLKLEAQQQPLDSPKPAMLQGRGTCVIS